MGGCLRSQWMSRRAQGALRRSVSGGRSDGGGATGEKH